MHLLYIIFAICQGNSGYFSFRKKFLLFWLISDKTGPLICAIYRRPVGVSLHKNTRFSLDKRVCFLYNIR